MQFDIFLHEISLRHVSNVLNSISMVSPCLLNWSVVNEMYYDLIKDGTLCVDIEY